MMGHTPGPLTIDPYGTVRCEDGNTMLLTGVALATGRPSPTAGENTREMVRRWNAHDALLAALEAVTARLVEVLGDYDGWAPYDPEDDANVIAAREAIAAARG